VAGEHAERDLRLVVAARFISRAGGEAAFFVGVWGKAAYDFHATPSQIALLMATMAVCSIAGTVASGVLVDRYGPKRVLAVSEAFFVPVALSFVLPGGMGQLTLLAGLLGLFGAPVLTAAASFAPFLVASGSGLDRVNAWIEGATSLSFVVGPAIGAVLVQTISIDWVFVFDALTSVVAVALISGVKVEHQRSERRSRAWEELKAGLRYAYSHRSVRYPVLLGTATWLGFGAFGALEPLFYRDVLRTGVATIGWVNALFGLGLVAGAGLTRLWPDRLRNAKGLAVACIAVGFGALLYVGTHVLPIVAVGALVWGAIIGLTDVLLRVLVQSASPDDMVGRIAGVTEMHRQAGELLPLAVAPALAAALGVQATLVGGGLVLALLALLSLPEAVAVDRTPRVREVRAGGLLDGSDEPVSPNP